MRIVVVCALTVTTLLIVVCALTFTARLNARVQAVRNALESRMQAALVTDRYQSPGKEICYQGLVKRASKKWKGFIGPYEYLFKKAPYNANK